MICAVHALVGAAIGRLVERKGGAFASGVATHLIGDLLPHKDFDPKVEAPLLAVAMTFLVLRFGLKSPEFLGAVGAVAPDVENAARAVGLIAAEDMKFPTHTGEHRHGPKVKSALPQGILAAGCLAYLLISAAQEKKRG